MLLVDEKQNKVSTIVNISSINIFPLLAGKTICKHSGARGGRQSSTISRLGPRSNMPEKFKNAASGMPFSVFNHRIHYRK